MYLHNKIRKEIEDINHVRIVSYNCLYFDYEEDDKKVFSNNVEEDVIKIIKKYLGNQKVCRIKDGWRCTWVKETGIELVNFHERYGEGKILIQKNIILNGEEMIGVGVVSNSIYYTANTEADYLFLEVENHCTVNTIKERIKKLEEIVSNNNNKIMNIFLNVYKNNIDNINRLRIEMKNIQDKLLKNVNKI